VGDAGFSGGADRAGVGLDVGEPVTGGRRIEVEVQAGTDGQGAGAIGVEGVGAGEGAAREDGAAGAERRGSGHGSSAGEVFGSRERRRGCRGTRYRRAVAFKQVGALQLALDTGDPENLVVQLQALRREQLNDLAHQLDELDAHAEQFLTQRQLRRPVESSALVRPRSCPPLTGHRPAHATGSRWRSATRSHAATDSSTSPCIASSSSRSASLGVAMTTTSANKQKDSLGTGVVAVGFLRRPELGRCRRVRRSCLRYGSVGRRRFPR
jgi:hypothetical protein